MNQAKQHQTLQSLNQLMKPNLVMKITKLVLSAYVFSFLYSYSSWLSNLLQCSSSIHFYTFPLQLFDRKCMFIICNGILVFLASNSGLFNSSPPESNYIDHEFPSETQQVPLTEKEVHADVVEEEIKDKFIIGEEKTEEIDQQFYTKNEEEKEWIMIEEQEDDEEEENGDHEGTEELNKKFDDFIRRMKEEIRIEARQQLVLVK